ncbi:MAG: fimbrillin family protein [Bacteroidales bacterium]|nr:fimbrillin family protein [Bacteroidales bacterium]
MKKIFILAATVLLAAVACNKGGESPVVPSKGGPVRFATNLNSYTVKSSLAENDQIGVFAGAPITRLNVLGTVTSSKGVAFASGSEICWQAGQTAATTFAAYYPYSASCNATAADPFKFTFTLAADQSSAEGVAAADLLTAVASNVAVPADPEAAEPVTLTFTHQGAKFVVNVTKEISAAVESVEILGTKLTGVVDMANKTVTDHSGDAASIIANRPNSAANTFEAIILPAADIAPQIKVTVEGGTTYTYSMNGTMTFVAGKQYTATVNIAAQAVSTDAASFSVGDITDWDVVATPLSYGDNPVVESNVWSVIGQVNGLTDWTEDFPMEQSATGTNPEDGTWEIDITVDEGPDANGEGGSEFKIRWAAQWGDGTQPVSSSNVVSIGMNPEWWYADGKGDNDEGLQLWQANAKNIKCKEAGTYHITLFYPSCKVFVEKKVPLEP